MLSVWHGDFKHLARRSSSDKVLHNKAFNNPKNPKYDCYQRGLASMVYKFFDQKSSATRAHSENLTTQNKFAGSAVKNEIALNQKLVEEWHKLIITSFEKRKPYSSFKDNIWGADLADMELKSKFNKELPFLLYVIDIYSKYAWVVPLKNKKDITITNY